MQIYRILKHLLSTIPLIYTAQACPFQINMYLLKMWSSPPSKNQLKSLVQKIPSIIYESNQLLSAKINTTPSHAKNQNRAKTFVILILTKICDLHKNRYLKT